VAEEAGELDQDNQDAPLPPPEPVPKVEERDFDLEEQMVQVKKKTASSKKGKVQCASLNEIDEDKPVLMPPNPTRDLQMEIEDLRTQKQQLHRENNALRSTIDGFNASCPSRALLMHANTVERREMRYYHSQLCSDMTPERQSTLSAELKEAVDAVTEGSRPVQDPAFAAMAPAELVAYARAVQPRLNWVLDQLLQFLQAQGFETQLQTFDISEPDGVDASSLGDYLRASFVLSIESLEEVYAAALLLARAPVMARRGTRWVGVVDRFNVEDADAYSDICFSMAVDGHIAEIRVCSQHYGTPGQPAGLSLQKWATRASEAEAVLMGAIENMDLTGATETSHSGAALAALGKMTEIRPVCDKNGMQAVHYAALHGNLLLLQRLANLGADLFAEDNQGNLPLHRPVMRRNFEVASWLLEQMIPVADRKVLSLVAKRKLVELWQWAIHAGGRQGHVIEGLPTLPWSTVQQLLKLAAKLHADTVTLSEGGRNAADYVAEFGDPIFLQTVTRELGIEPKAYATDQGCASGINNGYRGLLLTMKIRRVDWSGIKSMGREKPLTDFAGYLSRNRCLEELVMWECALDVNGTSALFSALAANSCLRRLDLMRNPRIGSEIVLKDLASSLAINETLQELVLSGCQVSVAGVAILCSGLAQNHGLRKLNLRENKEVGTSEALGAIASCLTQNNTLEDLDLWECGITPQSVVWLYNGLARNKGLKMLGLVGNRGLGQQVAIDSLSSTLEKNSTLESLTMSGCNVRPGSIDDPRVVL